MIDLKSCIAAVPDCPRPGILFRDIMPLLRTPFAPTMGAALALHRQMGFIPIRKQGRLPPQVASLS